MVLPLTHYLSDLPDALNDGRGLLMINLVEGNDYGKARREHCVCNSALALFWNCASIDYPNHDINVREVLIYRMLHSAGHAIKRILRPRKVYEHDLCIADVYACTNCAPGGLCNG
jgi:hypothetical protein